MADKTQLNIDDSAGMDQFKEKMIASTSRSSIEASHSILKLTDTPNPDKFDKISAPKTPVRSFDNLPPRSMTPPKIHPIDEGPFV